VIVVDVSAILEILLNTLIGSRVAARLSSPGETLHAPHLLDVEVAQVLRRYALAGSLDEIRAPRLWPILSRCRSNVMRTANCWNASGNFAIC
jgi:predicted nucleic acid-binding protein